MGPLGVIEVGIMCQLVGRKVVLMTKVVRICLQVLHGIRNGQILEKQYKRSET